MAWSRHRLLLVLNLVIFLVGACSSPDDQAVDGGSSSAEEALEDASAPMDAAVDLRHPHPDHQTEPLAAITAGPPTRVTAFFPAQASLQWLAADVEDYDHPVAGRGSTTTHPGEALTEPCANCHADDGGAPPPRELGLRLVDASPDVEDKRPYVDLDLRAAFDDQFFYLQASWTSDRPRPATTHQHFHFDGDSWERRSVPKDGDAPTAGDLDDHASNRYHHITFPQSIGTDDGADIQARDLR